MSLETIAGAPLSKLGVGASRIGSIGNATPPAEIRRMLAHALDVGINLFDTADIYGQGDSERELGRVLGPRRESAFVVTKIGQRFSLAARLVRPVKPLIKALSSRSAAARKNVVASRSNVIGRNFDPAYLRGALEASRKRLRFDVLDAVLLHGPSPEILMQRGAVDVLLDARRRGVVRHVGISCDVAGEADWLLGQDGCDIAQLPVDLLSEAIGTDYGPRLAARGVGVLAREVLRLQPDLPPAEAVQSFARRDDIASTIVGVSTVKHLDEMWRAAEAV